jgi:hypothetical protein
LDKLKFPYKNEQNQRFTRQLFFEQWTNLPIENRLGEPPFTLHADKEGYVNFGQEYIKDADPTGYTTAKRLLGDYSYWKFLMKVQWFREAKKDWDEELEAKLYAQGLAKIREIALGDDPKALAAAKYLANKEFKQGGVKRGRPSSDEVEGRLKQEVENIASTDADAERIGLKLVRKHNA